VEELSRIKTTATVSSFTTAAPMTSSPLVVKSVDQNPAAVVAVVEVVAVLANGNRRATVNNTSIRSKT